MIRALVVDDSVSWVKYHKAHLLANNENIDVDVAYSAREGYDWIYNMISSPYDLVITDLHMEFDFEPKYAGEWLVEQIKLLKQYANAKIVLCSASYDIKTIAANLNVEYIPKSAASKSTEFYKNILNNII